jgi:hypothetical protein
VHWIYGTRRTTKHRKVIRNLKDAWQGMVTEPDGVYFTLQPAPRVNNPQINRKNIYTAVQEIINKQRSMDC